MDDEIAIQQTLNRCSEAASRGAFDVVKTCYTADGIWEIPFGKYQGWDEIYAAVQGIIAPFEYIIQMNAPGVIGIDGDSAAARSVIYESAKYAGRDEAVQIHCIVHDKLVRTPDGWKFTHRNFVLVDMRNFALLPAA
jgi:hypothetical protein